MKNSKDYSQKVQKLYRSLKRKYPKVQEVVYDEPTDAVVYAVISEHTSETQAQSAIKGFAGYFIDWNDLRVSRAEEIIALLNTEMPIAKNIASTLTRTLMAVFNKYNSVSLMELKNIGKRPARQALEKLEGITLFAVDYCVLTSLQGHAIPLTKKMIEYLKSNELVDPDADEQQIEGFLTKQIAAKNDYEFYALLRRESESSKTGRKKTTRRTKTPKTTKRKVRKK